MRHAPVALWLPEPRQPRSRLRRFRPRVVAIVGIGAYRTAFRRPRAQIGLQPDTLASSALWILPNPSGLNANYQPAALADVYRELKLWVKSEN